MHEKTTDNLNYSYSELDSEWVNGNSNKDQTVSPLSTHTTSNKIQYGGLITKNNRIINQRGSRVDPSNNN